MKDTEFLKRRVAELERIHHINPTETYNQRFRTAEKGIAFALGLAIGSVCALIYFTIAGTDDVDFVPFLRVFAGLATAFLLVMYLLEWKPVQMAIKAGKGDDLLR